LTLDGEGEEVDIAVLERVAAACGGPMGAACSCGRKPALVQKLPGFNEAVRRAPWLVVADLDREPCAAYHARRLLSEPRLACACGWPCMRSKRGSWRTRQQSPGFLPVSVGRTWCHVLARVAR